MKKSFLALATVAGLALIAGQASAITTSATGTGVAVTLIPDTLYSWGTTTVKGGSGTVVFTNNTSVAQKTGFNWGILSLVGAMPTFSFAILNGGDGTTSLVSATGLPSEGNGSLVLAPGKSLSFLIAPGTGEVSATGSVAFAPVAPIPLPAGVLLLLTALGGLAATRKFSKKPELV